MSLYTMQPAPSTSKPVKRPTLLISTVKPSSQKAARSFKSAFAGFKAKYPEYALGSTLDALRKSQFARLKKANEVYVDYMGGCLYPESLVATHAAILQAGLFGNTHSDSPCATRSDFHIAAARNAVLDYFGAPSEEYACIFTGNATTALKIVGESFPFSAGSTLIIPADCHNSVNGIRRFAETGGANVEYLQSTEVGGFYEADAMKVLNEMDPNSEAASLFILTGQSNITGIRPSTSILENAKSRGCSTLIDAAALVSSTRVSLRDIPSADAMVVSFYKMFGYPTGVGALIAKKEFLAKLDRKWFSGGSVDFVQAPGRLTIHAKDLTARFEEGTLNYGSLSAIAPGLDLLKTYMPAMSTRLPALHHYLHTALESLVYPGTGTPLVRVHTKLRSLPLRRSTSTKSSSGEASDSTSGSENGSIRSPISPTWLRPAFSPTRSQSFKWLLNGFSSAKPSSSPITPPSPSSPISMEPAEENVAAPPGQGYVVSCTFYTSDGAVIPLSSVSRLASAKGISLRTGCVCNPGGSAALRGNNIQARMDELSKFEDNVPLKEVCTLMGGLNSAGIVRLSLGMVSNFEDVWRVVEWARGLLDESKRNADLERLNL
ncbi:hypothetical protein M408DRAFT_233582 [Serendipita vermifera MAFF 305830]|uniref:Aminotransferase class V domain-containing protein n=1 Tax=Serendipita vermifera MAFF 305830 TaxID=933852 RepID=A0A0C2WD64_SERVB|nr:hypothetical protein M408DRAFT_233582 [Serendipita vermifera MAFF 305830]